MLLHNPNPNLSSLFTVACPYCLCAWVVPVVVAASVAIAAAVFAAVVAGCKIPGIVCSQPDCKLIFKVISRHLDWHTTVVSMSPSKETFSNVSYKYRRVHDMRFKCNEACFMVSHYLPWFSWVSQLVTTLQPNRPNHTHKQINTGSWKEGKEITRVITVTSQATGCHINF